jgi:hypothetical protein
MATTQQEVRTPGVPGEAIHTPTAGYHQDQPDSAFRVDVAAAGSKEDIKEELEAGPRRKKFLWWRLTKLQFILAIITSVVVFLVLLIVILWFTAVKAIFQKNVDKVEMTVNYLDIKSIPSDSVLTGEMSLNLKHDLHMKATTDATTASLLYGGEEFATLEFPALDIQKGEQDYNLTINGDVTITNADVFEAMSTDVMDLSKVTLSASAKVKAHALGFSYGGLDFTRTLEFDGLNNFRSPLTVIDHIDFWGCENGYQMDIDVNVTNIAQMGLDGIGFLNLTLYVNDLYLGYLEGLTPEVGVPRGVSTETFRLHVEDGIPAMNVMVKALTEGYVQYFITGENPYATEHTLFKPALEAMNMSIIYTDAMDRVDLNTSCVMTVLPLAE